MVCYAVEIRNANGDFLEQLTVEYSEEDAERVVESFSAKELKDGEEICILPMDDYGYIY